MIERYLKSLESDSNENFGEVADRAFEEIKFSENETESNDEKVKTGLELDLAFEFDVS